MRTKRDAVKIGDYCVLITPEALIKRLNELNKNYGIDFKAVNYVKSDDLSKANAHFYGDISRFYYKDEDFAYQREYRLCLFEEMPKDHFFNVEPFNNNEVLICKSEGVCDLRFF